MAAVKHTVQWREAHEWTAGQQRIEYRRRARKAITVGRLGSPKRLYFSWSRCNPSYITA